VPFVDPNTVHNPATGTVAPAAWGDTLRDDLVFLNDRPTCAVFNTTNPPISSGVTTVLTANSERWDNDAMHSTVTNTSRITIQTEGRYAIASTVSFDGHATGVRGTDFLVNGTTAYPGSGSTAVGAGVSEVLTTIRFIDLNVSDYVETRAVQTSGTNLGVTLVDFTALNLTG
jgi:hypothetical protein